LVASLNGEGGSVKVNADVKLYAGLFDGNQKVMLDINPQRKAYVHLIKGFLQVMGKI